MITAFFVADRSEAARIATDPAAVSPALSTRNADNAVLADLWSAVKPGADTESLSGDDCIIYAEDGGPWVFELPESFVNDLADVSESESAAICDAWAEGEEMRHHGVSGSDLRRPLDDLRRVASEALSRRKQMLLLMSM